MAQREGGWEKGGADPGTVRPSPTTPPLGFFGFGKKTNNHYVLDAVAGFFLFTVAYLIARKVTRAGRGTPIATSSNQVEPAVSNNTAPA